LKNYTVLSFIVMTAALCQ